MFLVSAMFYNIFCKIFCECTLYVNQGLNDIPWKSISTVLVVGNAKARRCEMLRPINIKALSEAIQ